MSPSANAEVADRQRRTASLYECDRRMGCYFETRQESESRRAGVESGCRRLCGERGKRERDFDDKRVDQRMDS